MTAPHRPPVTPKKTPAHAPKKTAAGARKKTPASPGVASPMPGDLPQKTSGPPSTPKPVAGPKPAVTKKPAAGSKNAVTKKPTPATKRPSAGPKPVTATQPKATPRPTSTPRPTVVPPEEVPAVKSTPPLLTLSAPPVGGTFHATARPIRPLVPKRTALITLSSIAAVAVLAGAAVLLLTNVKNDLPPAAQSQAPAQATLPASLRSAEGWLMDNADRTQTLIVDDAMSADLVAAGWGLGDVIAYALTDTRPGVPGAWRDVDYVVTTAGMSTLPGSDSLVGQAMQNSVLVASFGSEQDGAQVRRVTPQGTLLASLDEKAAASARAKFGVQLSRNDEVTMTQADRTRLAAGLVDQRIVVLLGALAGTGGVGVAAFPVIDGEQAQPIRQVALTSVGGAALVAEGAQTLEAKALVDGLVGTYTPVSVSIDGAHLVLRYSVSLNPTIE